MKIKIDDHDRTFECVLHFAAVIGDELVAASFAGPGTATHSIPYSIIAGRRTVITDDNGNPVEYLSPVKNNYVFNTGKAGDAHHCVILSKDAIFSEESKNPVILAPDGDIAKAVGEYLVQRFPVPGEYISDYIKILDYKKARVIRDLSMETWKDLKVIQITSVKHAPGSGLTEEYLLEGIKAAQRTGILKIPHAEIDGKFDPSWTMKDYLRANAATLSDQIKSIKPRHNPDTDKLDPAIGQMDRIPFPAQAHVIQGLVNTLQEQNMALACGDMGTGKSIISLGVCNVIHKRLNRGISVLYCGPGIMIPKMHKKEIKETLPDATVQVIRNTEDALRYYRKIKNGDKPKGIEFVLVGIDRAKLGPEPWCAMIWKRVAGAKYYAWHCPDCGQPVINPKSKEEDYLNWEDVLHNRKPAALKNLHPNGLPKGFTPKWKLPAKVKKCPACNASLWRPALKSRGETSNRPRWFVSFVLRKLKRHFDLFIMDEVHQTKASDSGRGDAFTQLLKASKKTLCLTGTLVNGMSTSIKELIWRTDPRSLLREGFNHRSGTVAWARKYGVLERTIRTSEEDEGVITRRKKNEQQPRERPGIAPELVANHLLHRAAFLELGDLGLPLVELDEIPIFIQPDDEHRELYNKFHKELHAICTRAYMEDKYRGAFARFIPATINYGDAPHLGAKVEISRKGKVLYTVEAPKLDYFHAKERELVRLVQENLAEDRGCIIYCNYTDSYAIHHRLKDMLKAHGIEAHVLESHVSPEKRVEWLARKEKEGAKVIICNMRLVEVGLDLLPWPTIIFYQLNYDINVVRQASRRAWRIGQTRECRIYYLVYDGTQQADQFRVCMLKRAHAMLAEGRLDRSELSKFGRDGHTSLAADIASCLLDEETADKWKELARRDLDEGVELVEESKFLDVLSRAQKELARQTLELCGFTSKEIKDTLGEIEVEKRPTVLELAAFLPKRKKRRRKPKVLEGQLTLFDVV